VNTRRPGRDELNTQATRESESVVVAASTLRGPETGAAEPVKVGHPDDRLSMFWRVFGGTILSILALIAVTVYNNLQSNVTELRVELSRSNEARAELVKKEEFNARTQTMWDRLQALQELKATVSGLKEQVATYGEKQGDVKALRDQLAMIEQRLKSADEDHKALAKGAEAFIEAFANIYLEAVAAIRASIDGKKGEFDFPTVDDGVEGMAFIETAVKSAASNSKWTKFPKL